jgi:hypothetical protein
MPDAQFAPKFHDDVFINGDGQIDGISDGNHADRKLFAFAMDTLILNRNLSGHKSLSQKEPQGELSLGNTAIDIPMKSKRNG